MNYQKKSEEVLVRIDCKKNMKEIVEFEENQILHKMQQVTNKRLLKNKAWLPLVKT